MKVLFISRATLFKVRGGDTVQMENTAASLRKLGVAVDIELCNNRGIDYRSYSMIHFFNIIRPADILYHIRKSRLPFVVSPIYVEYDAATIGNSKAGLLHRMLVLMGKYSREYIKVVARAIRNGEKIVSPDYLFQGHKRSIRYILARCLHLLPNSHSEYGRLKRDFPEAGIYSSIPNAIDTSICNISPEDIRLKEERTILCVARFEPRKNQLNIIKALSGTDYKVIFVGNIAPNHQAYYDACVAQAGKNISFVSFISQDKLAALYRRYKVHILASWFETTGLSSLEAIACGCNIVISDKGDTREYFSDHAFYCDPGDPDSIRAAVEEAMKAPVDKAFMEQVKENNNWEVTARETYRVYQKVLRA